MPTYTVFSTTGTLSSERKAAIARAVTHTHSQVTGANTFFAQVVFQDVQPGDWFLGGARMKGDQIYLCGHARGGRPAEMKNRLVLGMRDVLVEHGGVARHQVWVYLVELPPAHMIEYGYVLPEPGQESDWLANMPQPDRERLEALGA
ncbi:tautomerase family protein [Variovorax sp. KK3]|uniref:tautomerase family protein n=1 Tax=Variovorax sp. KK3 TaxID=1855728 RepID=UPI00097BFCE8|nr:tautomerase family protein [Variovorax sp. KK3]